jgi:uridine phosphorylase
MVAQMKGRGRPLLQLPSGQPLWEVEHRGQRLAVFYPGMGAALASYSLELAIAVGCRSIVACGGAGALQSSLPMGHHVVTVTSAIRDEGASYHYLPPSREVQADPEVAKLAAAVLARRNLPHLAGRTWTTDGIFRETPARVARRRGQGCLTVEMEASALIAVAAFRCVRFGQLLYAGDDLSGEAWQSRDWKRATEVRELLVDVAADSALLVADRLARQGPT